MQVSFHKFIYIIDIHVFNNHANNNCNTYQHCNDKLIQFFFQSMLMLFFIKIKHILQL